MRCRSSSPAVMLRSSNTADSLHKGTGAGKQGDRWGQPEAGAAMNMQAVHGLLAASSTPVEPLSAAVRVLLVAVQRAVGRVAARAGVCCTALATPAEAASDIQDVGETGLERSLAYTATQHVLLQA
jgi:hypothetical protein